MDTIDVTSPEFSLGGISEINNVISDTISLGNISSDYTIYIYVGLLILFVIICYFAYKFYINRGKKVTFQDDKDNDYDNTLKK